MLWKKLFLILVIVCVSLEAKKKHSKHSKKHHGKKAKVPTTTSWYYWVEWAENQSKNYGGGDWSHWIPPAVTGFNNNNHDDKHDSKDHHHSIKEDYVSDQDKSKKSVDQNNNNNNADIPYYNGAPVSNSDNSNNQPMSNQPPMDSYPEGQEYQNNYNYQNGAIKNDIEYNKEKDKNNHDFYDFMCNRVQNETVMNNEDHIICDCQKQNRLNDGSLDSKGFNQCMNDKNGDNWKEVANRIEYWSHIYQQQFNPKQVQTEQSSSKIDFTTIAIISLIFSIVFVMLFSYQCFRFSWKSWKLRGYESVDKKKSKVVFIGDQTNNIV